MCVCVCPSVCQSVCVCDRELCFHALPSSERVSVTEKQAKRQSVKEKVRLKERERKEEKR